MISFHNQSIAFKFKGKTKIKQWIKAVTEKEKHKLGTINYIFALMMNCLKLISSI